MCSSYQLNDFVQPYFTAGIYCLHGKLTAVWNVNSVNLTEVKYAPKHSHKKRTVSCDYDRSEFHFSWNCHVNGKTFQSSLGFQTALSSLWISCKRALRKIWNGFHKHAPGKRTFFTSFFKAILVRTFTNAKDLGSNRFEKGQIKRSQQWLAQS